MKAVAHHAFVLRLLQQRFDTGETGSIDINRHLQPVIEFAEIRIARDVFS